MAITTKITEAVEQMRQSIRGIYKHENYGVELRNTARSPQDSALMQNIPNKELYERFVWQHQETNSLLGGIGQGAASTYATSTPAFPALKNPNDDPVYAMPLSALCDLWLAKYGAGWVAGKDKADDEFWATATERLNSAGRLEACQDSWFHRLIPKDA